MPRSFLVDSLVLREAGEKKGESSPPPPLFPYAVHPSHPLHGLPPAACHSRKAGLLCVCPLCVAASQLHPPPGLPLLKASFPPFGPQYCPAPLGQARQHSASAHKKEGKSGSHRGAGSAHGCKCSSLATAKCSEDDEDLPMSPSSSGKDDRDLTVTP
uniref:Uncharacterized protein n=1 Tax=Pelusios castaneus TaxID=367368 RepID=A0A8C8SRB4_9SAUR